MPSKLSKKKIKHNKIFKIASELGQDTFGFIHRDHRTRKYKTGKNKKKI